MNQKAYKLRRISLLKVSAFLIYRPSEAILEEMSRLGLQPADLRLLILTHAHYNHAGAARRVKEICGCRIMIHSPGHTPGSMVVLMEGGEMLAGDSLFGLAGKRIFPPFAEDPAALMESWELISSMDVRRFFPAHGASISPESFLSEYRGLRGWYTE